MSTSAPPMSGALTHPLVQRIPTYQHDMATGQLAAAREVFQPDVRYRVAGQNVLSGDYVGPDAVMGYFGRLMTLTGGTYAITHMQWFAGDDRVALETANRATIGAQSLEWAELITFEFRDGRKARIDLLQANQSAVDAFFGP